MKKNKKVKTVEKIFNTYLKNYSTEEIVGKLIYFYQFLDIHNTNMKGNGYEKLLKAIKDNFENNESLNIIGNYAYDLIAKLIKEKDEIKKIEYKIALDNLSDYFLSFTKNKTKNKLP
ncbi:hypothetical protein CO054_00165 [Candidatus Shapirobacteria bacterium CG_4_9_14_0_2_um_filter_39_11]|uniref:Uncharacterized protein n=1 Tax=Candidatus Shapirobacteria bacterium CG_4_9_14_0_2_um_filter_39_11 TaxID=1974478 RepID=A0A2M8ETJ7_9BACT|nr:MAG: hypothetical protein CO054_00165 [Candidatus Shapirobacteria bacterium CG_4_9_14_0_2_um_filter_39_11]